MKVWRQSQTGSGESETDDIPHRHLEPARIARNEMVEAIVATDEALTHQYLAGHEISPEQLIQALRHAVIADQVTPVLFGSALKNIGVQAVLNAVVRYLPSPADVGQTEGTDPRSGEQAYRCAHPTEPFCALVFKIVSDPWIGRLAYLRVYSGQLIAGDRIYNSTRRQEERINRILQMYAQKREEIETCSAGDIVAVAGLKQAYTGDTICTPQAPILLEPIQFPLPVIRIAVAPNSQIEQEKLLDALRRLADEDPTFEVHYDVETDQTVISGMGELHLEIIVDRLKREYHVGCAVSAPLPAYRETITRRASAEGRYIHQTGGAGHYAIVRLALAPAQPGQGIQFVNQTPAMVLPDNYVAGAERGIRASLEAGELAGFPVTDVRVMITGGRFHEVDSHKQDFEIAGSIALKQAYRHAAPILLEPIMQVVTTVAEDYIGSVTKDFAVRQGKIISIDMEPEERYIVHAEVPLRAMFGYVTTLRSLTSGRGYFSMQYLHYKPVADDIAAVIIAERKPGDRH